MSNKPDLRHISAAQLRTEIERLQDKCDTQATLIATHESCATAYVARIEELRAELRASNSREAAQAQRAYDAEAQRAAANAEIDRVRAELAFRVSQRDDEANENGILKGKLAAANALLERAKRYITPTNGERETWLRATEAHLSAHAAPAPRQGPVPEVCVERDMADMLAEKRAAEQRVLEALRNVNTAIAQEHAESPGPVGAAFRAELARREGK